MRCLPITVCGLRISAELRNLIGASDGARRRGRGRACSRRQEGPTILAFESQARALQWREDAIAMTFSHWVLPIHPIDGSSAHMLSGVHRRYLLSRRNKEILPDC